MEAHEIISKNVRAALKKKGWTQADLAKVLGITREAVNQALGRNITVDTLFQWADKIGIDPAELLVGPATSQRTLQDRKLAAIAAILSAECDGDILGNVEAILKPLLDRLLNKPECGAGAG